MTQDAKPTCQEDVAGWLAAAGEKIYLVMVDGQGNNNKWYQAGEMSDGTVRAAWGRVGSLNGSKVYQPWQKSLWDIKHEKTRKGYQDHSNIHKVADGGAYIPEDDPGVHKMLHGLLTVSRQFVNEQYTVSPDTVTQAQIDHAQSLIDALAKMASGRESLGRWIVNRQLEQLWTVVPRRMVRVGDHQFQVDPLVDDIRHKLDEEQKILDAMAAQVKASLAGDADQKLSDRLGLIVERADDDRRCPNRLGFVFKDHQGSARARVRKVFKVVSIAQEQRLRKKVGKQKGIKLLYHGSRTENWLSVLNTGLILHPDAARTGSMLGHGLYFAEQPVKSLGYCGLSSLRRWHSDLAEGVGYLALFKVWLGNSLILKGRRYSPVSFDGRDLRRSGYDSVSAFAGWHTGFASLMNNEFVVYQEDQASIRYLLEVEAM